MTLSSQYIYSSILYTVNNKHLFNSNNEIYKYKTRNINNLHFPTISLSKFNKGANISGIKVFNHFLHHLKALINNQKCFKSALKTFFIYHFFFIQ